MTGILLAGGKNTRMGINKAFLEMDEARLIDRILAIFHKLFSETIIVTNDPLSYTEFTSATTVTDIYKNKGALGGIYSGLFFASEYYSFVTACDMPFLNKDLIIYLSQQVNKHDIVVPLTSKGFQPLHAIYSKNCLTSIKKHIDAGKFKITGFYKGLRVLTITEEALHPFDKNGQLFLNINTPKELELLKQEIKYNNKIIDK